ncbi:PHD and RING finger domain-containing protein 1 [Phytophthora cinnamomi]|uniref:PHD and RING finger domain-containing protein 1 n=1 Tax=Phytophthora cinnamomi TaxID=4785 RepID=UPI003559B691|nr:PHD and RING finger domain-containing protein 1 [Phytophthora cinnamomi]
MADEEKRRAPEAVDLVDDDEDQDDNASAGGHNDEDEDVDTEEDACCICQDLVDVLKQGFLSGCDHRFHFDCIVAWAKVTNLCPLCKTKFNSVTRQDARGVVVHREAVQDHKQVYRPDPSDHDFAAQLRLVNQARCELCGSGEDEHVLLLCEALGCGVANHTYCIGLRSVPNTSWYCSRHANTQQRASDAIERPATTVSTRRRTRRLASLMSNVLRGRGGSAATRSRRRENPNFIAVEEAEDRRPMRGIAAAYALRMSRELMQVQLRADAMFARGDLTQSSLYGRRSGADATAARSGTRSTVTQSGSSTIDQMWEDHSRSRQELAAAAIAGHDHSSPGDNGSSRPSQRSNRVSNTFAPEYCDLARLMQDAVNSDNYASSVSLLIPKTAKLRLVSRVKTFFGRLNQKEKAAAVELGCLSVMHQWICVSEQDTVSAPNVQVLDAVLGILETLPVRKQDLVEEESLQDTMDRLSELSDVSIESRQRIIELSEKWRELNPPAPVEPPQLPVSPRVSSPVSSAQNLPVITSFTSPKRPTRPNGKRKRKREAWSDTVVEYVKAKLYPLYKQNNGAGKLTKDRFKAIVKEVTELFSQEAASMQSALLLPSGELSNLAKSRIKKLIDRVYKSSANGASGRGTSAPTPLLMRAAVPASTYSAVPSIKHQRRR